jgi:hypothetical protein
MLINKYQVALVDTGATYLSYINTATVGVNPTGEPITPPSGVTFDGLDCEGTTPLAILTPPNWTACNLTFNVLPYFVQAGGNIILANLYDATNTGTLYTIPTVANGQYALDPVLFNGLRYINAIRSVAQSGGEAFLNFVLTPLWQGIHN